VTAGPAEAYLERLDAVGLRLDEHARARDVAGLTGADPATGERWEAGQVWAHLAEFIPYWIEQARIVLAAPTEGASFGRTQADEGRIAAVERDRGTPVAELSARLSGHRALLAELIAGLTGAEWVRTGTHPTLGPMTVEDIVERFLVGHLEEHAEQLDALRR
jgi:DinB family protein